MSNLTLAERCSIALACVPPSLFREQLERLFSELLSKPQPLMDEGQKLWLWKNGDHFWAFTNLYPCYGPDGDPMTLGEPVGHAVFKHSENRRGKE